MKQAVFQHVDTTQQYGCIGDRHLVELANYLCAQGKIDRLLVHGLQHNRFVALCMCCVVLCCGF